MAGAAEMGRDAMHGRAGNMRWHAHTTRAIGAANEVLPLRPLDEIKEEDVRVIGHPRPLHPLA